MPNHITNNVKILSTGGHTNIIESCLDDEDIFDFDRILPMPECLKTFQPHCGVLSRAKLALGLLKKPNTGDPEDINDFTDQMEFSNGISEACTPLEEKDFEAVIRAMQNHMECGYMYWYDWRQDNWDTKWGAYDCSKHDVSAGTISFDTAWSTPYKVFRAWSKKFPDAVIEIIFADEDTGSNCGTYIVKGGEVISEDLAPRWDEMTEADKAKWTEFAFNVKYADEDPRSHGYGPDWVHSEDIYDAYEAEQEKEAS